MGEGVRVRVGVGVMLAVGLCDAGSLDVVVGLRSTVGAAVRVAIRVGVDGGSVVGLETPVEMEAGIEKGVPERIWLATG